MSYVGKLERKGMLRFLKKVESQARNGLLTIKYGDRRIELYFQHGECISVFDTSMQDTLEDRRLLEEIVTQDIEQKVQRARSTYVVRPKKEADVAHMLVDQGYVTREQIDAWIMRRAGQLLQQVFTWSRCEVFFADGVTPSEDRLLMTHDRRSLINALFTEGQPVVSPRLTTARTTRKLPLLTDSSAPTLPELPGGEVAHHVLPGRPDVSWGGAESHSFLPLSEMITTAKITVVKHRARSRLYGEIVLVVLLLLIAAVAHGYNMFHYPYIEDDEGTYMFQASAVVHIGKLAYYTYWYDHAPAGWIQIAIWTVLTGGFHAFGSTLASGRILMMVMQVISTFLVYRIGRGISKNIAVPIAAALLFALSPYGLYYHRRILLDNIMTLWMLLSIYWLVVGKPALGRFWMSAVALAISVLSKEVTVFLVPIMLLMIFWRADRSHRVLALCGWLALFVSIVSLYPLMATIKNELLPAGTLLGDHSKHVSLIESVFFQSARAQDGGILSPTSMVRTKLTGWIIDDPILCIGGGISTVLALLFVRKRPSVSFMGLATISMSLFLLRNGLVLDFYLVPLLPLLALTLVLVLESLVELALAVLPHVVKPNAPAGRLVEQGIIVCTVLGTMMYYLFLRPGLGFHGGYLSDSKNPFTYWTSMQADTQMQAMAWVEQNLPHSSRLVIDESMGPDLFDHGYKLAHYYWRVEEDPAIGGDVFHNDWRTFDYIITTPQMLDDVNQSKMRLIQDGVAHSTPVARFKSGAYLVQVLRVHK